MLTREGGFRGSWRLATGLAEARHPPGQENRRSNRVTQQARTNEAGQESSSNKAAQRQQKSKDGGRYVRAKEEGEGGGWVAATYSLVRVSGCEQRAERQLARHTPAA